MVVAETNCVATPGVRAPTFSDHLPDRLLVSYISIVKLPTPFAGFFVMSTTHRPSERLVRFRGVLKVIPPPPQPGSSSTGELNSRTDVGPGVAAKLSNV